MITFKQLEAFVAQADAGSFEQAARNLKTAQSAVSRHVAEFEAQFSTELLDRSGRRALLTLDGVDVLKQCRAILRDRDDMLSALTREPQAVQHMRLGVTEITALTWLHRFLDSLQQDFPDVRMETRVEQVDPLHHLLAANELDMIVVPDNTDTGAGKRIWMGRVESRWYCSPTINPGPAGLSVHDLSAVTLLTKGASTHSGVMLEHWMRSNSISPRVIISSGSTTKLLDLLVSGAGFSYLPTVLVHELLCEEKVIEVPVQPTMQAVNYALLARRGSVSSWQRNVMALAKASCDFSKRYLAPPSIKQQSAV